jgi:anti-sigma regulatory factor (Ser/Thr protein kinase)
VSQSLSLALPVDLRTPKLARDAVAATFDGEPRVGDLLLCVSEVVTNAVRHARTAGLLTVDRDARLLTVEVHDGSDDLPIRRPMSAIALNGRGLRILDQLATRWGTRSTGAGKVVWFEFDLDQAGD